MSIENIKLTAFRKQPAVYYFESNNEIIYVGSSKNLHNRMSFHKTAIKKGLNSPQNKEFYQFLQSNPFTIHFAYCDDYREEEQKLIDLHNPIFNKCRVFQTIENRKKQINQYNNRFCNYNGEILSFNTLRGRFARNGVEHPHLEAKKYLIGGNND